MKLNNEVIAGMIEEIGAREASQMKLVTISPEWTVSTPAGSVIAITSEGNFKFDGSSWIHVS